LSVALNPTANAAVAHEPDPSPRKHADDEADGTSPTGHADEGNTTTSEPTRGATAATTAAERKTKRPTHDEAENDRAEYTVQPTTDERTRASTPDAQPTATNARGETTAKTADKHGGTTDRDPLNARAEAPATSDNTDDGTSEHINHPPQPTQHGENDASETTQKQGEPSHTAAYSRPHTAQKPRRAAHHRAPQQSAPRKNNQPNHTHEQQTPEPLRATERQTPPPNLKTNATTHEPTPTTQNQPTTPPKTTTTERGTRGKNV
jgi:hypothetical protein